MKKRTGVNFEKIRELVYSTELPEELQKVFFIMANEPFDGARRFSYKFLCTVRDAQNPRIDLFLFKKLVDKARFVETGEGGFEARLWDALWKEPEYKAFAENLPDEMDFLDNPERLWAFCKRYLTEDARQWAKENIPEQKQKQEK